MTSQELASRGKPRTSRNHRPGTKLGHDPILMPIGKLQTSPENDKLYRPITPMIRKPFHWQTVFANLAFVNRSS